MTKHENIILMTDSYKVTHWRQYPTGTSHVFSFLESRGGVYANVTFFGLQYIIKRYFEGVVVREEDIVEAREFFAAHFGDATLFNEAGWRYILEVHGGRLPVRIKAVAEGTTVPGHNVLVTVENLDPNVPWLTNYLETILSQVWYPTTVATQSRAMKAVILNALDNTGDPALADFKLHDFGYRGSTSNESAGIGGAAHLVNFKGTDTLEGIRVARDYYHEPMAGFSIPAAEHSTITSWGKDHEDSAYSNMLESFPYGLVAVVSDSYDVFKACSELWGKKLRDKVLNRDGVLIVRPDSGDPPTVVIQVLRILGKAFGYEINAKGFKVLNPKVRVIQGDGIDYQMLDKILQVMDVQGWSADNIAFGSGGGLLQKVNRDTLKFAFKCSAVRVKDEWREVYKDPVTDPGKRSKAGRLALVIRDGKYMTVVEEAMDESEVDQLITVFENGKLVIDQTFSEIRERALKM
jgi:nicotinamide phosphoribosyltransferase